jgi:hypothetical protein
VNDELEARVRALVGQPLVGSHRVVDLESFQFGDPAVPFVDRKGVAGLQSRYAVHVQCPWRIIIGGSLVVGYGDLREPNSLIGDSPLFDPDKRGTTLREERLAAFYLGDRDRPRRVIEIATTQVGDLRIHLDRDTVLEVFPDTSASGREYWRLIDTLERWHLVVGRDGAQFLP